jgi:glucosamine--fructose-6-phosphate aminotransferase (isomerizing)
LLSIWFSQIHNINEFKRIKIIKDLHNLSNDFNNTIETIKKEVKTISEQYYKYNNMFLLGKNTDECIAREGSLKVKEISYIHSEAYSISSLKHGPFALLDENFPVIILNTIEENYIKIDSCVEEILSRLSPIIMITNDFKKLNEERKSYLKIINIPKNSSYSSLLANIPLQFLAYYLSVKRKINPDIPKNLAKVVTVD